MTLLDPRFRRNRYAKLVHLSECHLAAGDLEQALHTAGQALDLHPDVRCARWHVRLRRLRDTTARVDTPHARAFVDRYDTLA